MSSAGADDVRAGGSALVEVDDRAVGGEFFAEGCVVVVECGDDSGCRVEPVLEVGPLALDLRQLRLWGTLVQRLSVRTILVRA